MNYPLNLIVVKKIKHLLNVMLLSVTFFVTNGLAQIASPNVGSQVPMSKSYTNYFEASLYRLSDTFFTDIRPFIPQEVASRLDTSQYKMVSSRSNFTEKWLGRKLFNEDLIGIKGDGFNLFINPIVDFSFGKDNNWQTQTPFVNTRGLRLTGNITPKFYYETEFYENQALFPRYVHDFIQYRKVIPGLGITKNFTKQENYDFSYARGSIAYQPNKFFNFRLGNGKHFWGDGYRSLLLSDNAPSYPYFQIMTTFWKIRYVNVWAQMLDNTRIGYDGTYARKYVSSHFLSYNITKRLNIGIFESAIYGDSIGTRGLDVNYLNPIIFFRPVEYSLNSDAGNIVLGLNLKFKLTDKQSLYGQFLLDDINTQEIKRAPGYWGLKYGYQLGLKSFHTFIPNLTLQTEYNWVRPYTYSHFQNLGNYGHYNQSLAHPLGGNFKESVTNIRYFYKRWFAEGRLMFATQGRDSLTKNFGSDIYQPNEARPSDFGISMLQGIKTKTMFTEFKTGFLVNPRTNLRLEVGIALRNLTPEKEVGTLKKQSTTFFSFGLKSDLNNVYYDF
jgi:hypothetical protein